MVDPQLQYLHLGKLLRELRQPHPEAFPSVLGELQQGLVFTVRPSHRQQVENAEAIVALIRFTISLLCVHDVVLSLAFAYHLQDLLVLCWVLFYPHSQVIAARQQSEYLPALSLL